MSNGDNYLREEAPEKSAAQLHEAILANSYPVVQLLLDSGIDPNCSPLLAPSSIVTNTNGDRSLELLLTLGRMFRSQRDGCIHPLEAAVVNAYHNALSGSASAIQIIEALLEAGANINNSSHGIVLCHIGSHKYLKFRGSKTAVQLALLLKQLPLPDGKMQCTIVMEEVTRILLCAVAEEREEEEAYEKFLSATTFSSHQGGKTIFHAMWKGLLNDESTSLTDIAFICPDGRIEAHKCILGAENSYFHSTLTEKNRVPSSPFIWKTSNSVLTMKIILQFIYTGDLSNSNKEGWIDDEEYLAELLQAASDFKLDSLINACGKLLSSPFYLKSPESCKFALKLAKRFGMKDLFNVCIDYIQKNHVSILTNRTFIDLSKESIELWKEMSAILCSRNDSKNFPPKKKRKVIGKIPLYSPKTLEVKY